MFGHLKFFYFFEFLLIDDYLLVDGLEELASEQGKSTEVVDLEVGDEKITDGISRFYLFLRN